MDSFFGIGMFELVLIAIIALVVLGPERLPGAMREVAKYMRQLRDLSGEFQSQFSEELKMLDELNPKRIISDSLAQPTQPPTKTQTAAGTKPTSPTAKPAAAKAPAAKPSDPKPVEDGSPNTILPPEKTADAAASAPGNGVDGISPTADAVQSDTNADGPAEDAR